MAEEKTTQNTGTEDKGKRSGGKRPFRNNRNRKPFNNRREGNAEAAESAANAGGKPRNQGRPQGRGGKPTGNNGGNAKQSANNGGNNAPANAAPAAAANANGGNSGNNGNNGGKNRRDNRRTDTRPPRSDARRNGGELRIEPIMTDDQKAFMEAKDILLDLPVGEDGKPVEPQQPQVEIVGVRFKQTGKIYYFDPLDIKFDAGDGVIVETARGQEYGMVALANRMVNESETSKPLKPVIRKATEADTEKHINHKSVEQHATDIWDELVARHGLTMSLTDVEYTFDETKLVFFFTAEGRVDFRELVKDLASVFRTRIELRQIGVRDEAKLVGGLGVCGMPFCCHRFLPDFVQVSIKMAKEQNLSLSSSKISGNCGRLMCCLRYEQDVYECEYKTFPRTDMIVQTAQGKGTVIESNFLNGKIKVKMDGEGNAVIKNFTRDEVKVIGKAARSNKDPIDKDLKNLED